MPSRFPIAAAIVGSIVVIGAILILLLYQGTDKVVVAGLYVTIIGVVFGYLQSVTNTAKIAAIEPKVDQAVVQSSAAVVAVADNTELTQKAVDTGEQTYVKVDGQMTEFRKTLAQLATQQIAVIQTQARLDATQAQLDQALSSARAMEAGRQQVMTETAPAQERTP